VDDRSFVRERALSGVAGSARPAGAALPHARGFGLVVVMRGYKT